MVECRISSPSRFEFKLGQLGFLSKTATDFCFGVMDSYLVGTDQPLSQGIGVG